jgi:quercetin dioxygenase-like cupin family protein
MSNDNTHHGATLVEPGKGDAIWFLNSRMTVKATAATTAGGFGLIESVIPPGFSPPMHIHHLEDESYFVLDGELTVRCGDETYAASAGSFVFLPRDVPHTFVVEGDKPARWLTITTPGGGEGFFIDAGRPAETDGFPAPAPIDIGLLQRVSEKYGDEIVGPPLTARTSN